MIIDHLKEELYELIKINDNNKIILSLVSNYLNYDSTYINKKIVERGISRENFFYYMCLTMVFFSLGSLGLEAQNNTLKFELSLPLVILLILAMILRYLIQTSFVGYCIKLEPYEFETYMSFSLVICFIMYAVVDVDQKQRVKTRIVQTFLGIFGIIMAISLVNIIIRLFT